MVLEQRRGRSCFGPFVACRFLTRLDLLPQHSTQQNQQTNNAKQMLANTPTSRKD